MAEIKIPGIVKTIALLLATTFLISVSSSIVVYFLAPAEEIRRLTLAYSSAGSASMVLALLTIFLRTNLFANLVIATVWWLIGGIIAGFILKFFQRDPISVIFWILAGIFTPVIAGLITGYAINALVVGSPSNMAGYLATQNILGGVIGGIGANSIGARASQSVFASRVAAYEAKLHDELFKSEIEPLHIKCPKCGDELHAQALYCSSCGNSLSSETIDESA